MKRKYILIFASIISVYLFSYAGFTLFFENTQPSNSVTTNNQELSEFTTDTAPEKISEEKMPVLAKETEIFHENKTEEKSVQEEPFTHENKDQEQEQNDEPPLKENQIQIVQKENNLHQPILDERITRSNSKVYLLLLDAKDKLLEPNIVVNVRIWRKIKDDLWIYERAHFNHKKSRVECQGDDDLGLEPGYYALEIDGGGYGILKRNFELKRNEDLSSTFVMPNYSKVIAVQFVDSHGNDATYTRNKPIYEHKKNLEPFSTYQTKEYLVLRNAPRGSENRIGGGRRRPVVKSTPPIGDYVFKPDNGRYYIRVFSGQMASLSYEYRENEGQLEPFILESDFKEDDFNLIKIQLRGSPHITENTIIHSINNDINNKDIGINTNLNPPEETQKKEDFSLTQKGFGYQIKHTPYPIQLEYKYGKSSPFVIKNENLNFQKNFSSDENIDEIDLRFTDKKLFNTKWENLVLDDQLPVFREAQFNLNEFKVKIALSPTFHAMAIDATSVYLHKNTDDFALLNENDRLYFTSLYQTEGNSLEESLMGLNLSIKSRISVTEIKGNTLVRITPKNFELYERRFSFPLSIHAHEIRNDSNHEITISPIKNTLILRAIDLADAGLPWVEASIIHEKSLGTALEIKEKMENPQNYKFLMDLISDYYFIRNHPKTKEEFAQETEADRSDIQKQFRQIITTYLAYDYFIRYGAWYNSIDRSISDSKGYLILSSDKLIAGEKYTLFLWNQSTDELKPDKQITFIAKDGITDLGAIVFDE